MIQKIKILRRQNPFKEATSGQQLYQHLEEAILLLDDLRQAQSTTSAKLDILKETDWVYKTAIETCYTLYQTTKEQKYLEQIYFLIEKSKSVLLADILNDKKAKAYSNIPQELQVEEKELLRDLSVYEVQLYQAQKNSDSIKIKASQDIIFDKRNQLKLLQKRMTSEFPNYQQLAAKHQITPLSDLQQLLTQQDAVFYLILYGTMLYMSSVAMIKSQPFAR